MITTFTPIAGLLGGALIGLAAFILMMGSGRIAGCSGIFRGLIGVGVGNDYVWRLLFVAGLIGGVALSRGFAANAANVTLPGLWPSIIGGLCVGFGTALANGCTSGHGICGMSRFSLRSTVAVGSFMAVAIATVFITHHLLKV